ncbi:MAG: DUF1320 family protein [Victivallaceae bacterium]|nr:DUF1320 family protein [Victivallaceae bacterium]
MYAAPDEYKARLGESYFELYRQCGDAAAVSDLEAASAEIDSALSGRYETPVRGNAALLSHWCIVLAEEIAWTHTPALAVPESLDKAASRVRDALAKYAAGALRFPGSPQTGVVDLVEADEPVFTRDRMRGY